MNAVVCSATNTQDRMVMKIVMVLPAGRMAPINFFLPDACREVDAYFVCLCLLLVWCLVVPRY